MEVSLNRDDLKRYLGRQLNVFFPDEIKFEGNDIKAAIDLALERLEYCYTFIAVPAYNHDCQTWFSHLHGDQYSQFLYYFSNSLWKLSQNREICDKIMQLNRMLSGCFWSYKSGLPDIFYWSHPVGTVLGKAPYGNFFSCMHGCTVATQFGREKSLWGDRFYMGAGAGILSPNVKIGNNVVLGAGTGYYSSKPLEDSIFV